jgi:hypothetical protein
MPTISAVAFNTGSTIPGTTQIGNLSIGDLVLDFNALGQQYGVTYYATPDQDLGYVIGYPDIFAGHLGKPNDVPAKIGFFRSSGLTESSFIITAQYVTQMIGNPQTFLSGNAAKTWLNNNGFWTSYTFTYAVGQLALGGIIAYILQSGDTGYDVNVQHGLVASVSNLGGGLWGCEGTTLGGTSTALGTGAANTAVILSGCATRPIAASIVTAYNDGGYTDWYLPSYDELYKLWINRSVVGGFDGFSVYWTSSEGSNIYGIVLLMPDGALAYTNKNTNRTIRAVRSF